MAPRKKARRPRRSRSFRIASGGGSAAGGDLSQIQSNLKDNLPSMLIQSVTLSVTERVFKSVMRRPLANVNRNIVRPLLGNMVRV